MTLNIETDLNDSTERIYQILCNKDYWMSDPEFYPDTPAFREGIVYNFRLDPNCELRHPITLSDLNTYITESDNHGEKHYMTLENLLEGHFQLIGIINVP